jgi:hypothetical protein
LATPITLEQKRQLLKEFEEFLDKLLFWPIKPIPAQFQGIGLVRQSCQVKEKGNAMPVTAWATLFVNLIAHSGATVADVQATVAKVQNDHGNLPQEAIDAAAGLAKTMEDLLAGI